MEKAKVNFDMEAMLNGLPSYIREKARKAGSCIIYVENGYIIKEDPRTGQKTAVQQVEEKAK